MATKETFSRVKTDAQLKDVSWNLTDGRSVRYEYVLPDGTRASNSTTRVLGRLGPPLQVIADLRAEQLVTVRDLRRRVLDVPLRRLQPPRTRPVAVALAGRRPVLVVLPPDGVPALSASKASSTIRRVASRTSSARPSGDERRPSIRSESDWRVRIDPGTLFGMGCLLGSRRRPPALVCESSARMHPYRIFRQV